MIKDNKQLQRLGQIAGNESFDVKIINRTVQFLSLFGIDAGRYSNQVKQLIKFVKNMPQWKGQEYPDQYQSQWKGNAGVLQNQRQILSKDGSDFNVY